MMAVMLVVLVMLVVDLVDMVLLRRNLVDVRPAFHTAAEVGGIYTVQATAAFAT